MMMLHFCREMYIEDPNRCISWLLQNLHKLKDIIFLCITNVIMFYTLSSAFSKFFLFLFLQAGFHLSSNIQNMHSLALQFPPHQLSFLHHCYGLRFGKKPSDCNKGSNSMKNLHSHGSSESTHSELPDPTLNPHSETKNSEFLFSGAVDTKLVFLT